jgi:hypothetical protein
MVSAVTNVSVHRKSSKLFGTNSRKKNQKTARFGDTINRYRPPPRKEKGSLLNSEF